MLVKRIQLYGLIFLLFFCQGIAAQSKDQEVLYGSTTTAAKIEVLRKLCKVRFSMPIDSFKRYVELGLKYSQPNSLNQIFFERYEIEYLEMSTQPEIRLKKINQFLEKTKKREDAKKDYLYIKLVQISDWEPNKNYSIALKNTLQILPEVENFGDTDLIIDYKSTIGWYYMEQSDYKNAIKWFDMVYPLAIAPSIKGKKVSCILNNASCNNNLGNHDRALFLVNEGINLAEYNKKYQHLANGLNIRADIYLNTNRKELALADLESAVKYRAFTPDTIFLLSDMAQYSMLLAQFNRTEEGIALAKKALGMATKLQLIPKIIYCYEALEVNYRAAKKYKEWGETMLSKKQWSDSLQSSEMKAKLLELETQYETEKHQQIIAKQNLEIKNKKYLIYSILALFGLLLIFSLIWWYQYRKNNHTKLVLEISQATELERRRIAEDMHDGLGAYAAAIKNNIISIQSEVNNSNTEQLLENTNSMISQLNETIWVFKNNEIYLSELIDKFKVWLLKMIENFKEFDYEIEEHIEDEYKLSINEPLQLMFVLKEITTNSLKHSKGTKISFVFNCTSRKFKIEIRDNGIGIDPTKIKGSGLKNIERRCEAMEVVHNCSYSKEGTSHLLTKEISNHE